ncbi:DUF4870 domain-containing protein [Aureibaculum marinum]|uniref:DUF4870 domain-containing protein n=1 Tax=Aureibaculum marinum TaxID=2487930 RepID=A0A3N4NW07_9FLAO|nr:DUF4870 domain-containing protein [Aureibaculum marinum]RPE00016.1 DUF4870 domain-containing protein [Aureibaculum marinum]
MLTKNDKNIGTLIHLSAFFSFIFPFGSVIGPLIMWVISKDKSDYLNRNGVEAINFNLSYTLYIFILGLLMFPFAFGAFFNNIRNMESFDDYHFNLHFNVDNFFGLFSVGSLIGIIAFVRFLLIIVAAIKANRGEVYNYPLAINFMKDKN